MADISKITLPNGREYDLKDATARNTANSAVPNTRTVNGKALSSNISLGAGDVGAYTKKETDTKINAAIASAYKYKGSVTADKLPTSGQVVGDVYNITNDSSYGKAGMNVAWTGTTWDALGSNVDLSNYVTTSDSRLSNARPASDVYAWAKAASKPSYSASEISGLGSLATKNSLSAGDVGLGNVANLDQSKAIKSITRNGTTFTATALDGTTSTFTQQDINTTYGLASQSSNGLMSAADKSKLDGIGAGSNVKSVNGKTGAVSLSKADVGLGNVDNTADADKSVKYASSAPWNGVTGKPSTFPPSAHTHNTIYLPDTRSANQAPSWYYSNYGEQVIVEFKTSTVIGLSGFPMYCVLVTVVPWIDSSGGNVVQRAVDYATNKEYIRSGSGDSWSSWKSVAYKSDIPTSLPASDVYSWAKAENKPSYSASEINGLGSLATKNGLSAGDVGLGNVANIDQSKAIKSITRNGTTFTATALDGTTSTFTQQDTNTTYSVATSSADGLMSKSDKAKLDGIGAGSNVKSVNSKTGAVTLTKSDIGLGNVDNTSDANKAVFESRLRWGGTNIAGDISPIDAAMSNIHSANRAAFANPAGIIVEFSNDGGSTWADYGASDTSKIQLVSGIDTNYFIGKHTTNNTVTVNDKLRITVNASNCGFYTALKKILIYVSTNGAGGAYVELQKSYKGTETSWSSSERYSISGWSGWNSIPCSGSFGGGSNQTGNMANIRLTFGITSKGSSSYINSLSVQALQFLGTTYWDYHSEMAKSGHLYSYDENQNATFPAQVTAERFNGTVSRAMADSDGKWINSTYIKGLSVSGRTITYTKGNGTTGTITTQDTNTTYGVATTSADGLMSKADKAKLDGIGTGSNVKSVNGKTGAVTLAKGDVGLGSVANLDQSKAIKSITRSGTTFTATALDGTTTTFTQQDNNTTYGLASQSSNGLMSAADKKAVDREFFRMLPKGGTYIPANADLNSIQYLKVGNYYNSLSRESGTIKNIPANNAFIMYVLSPLLEVYDNESTAQWVYRLRIFVEYTGNIFIQFVNSENTAGSFNYGPWVKMTNSNDLGAVSKIINDHIANKSNPHGVTKAQVGLGNVDNTADSAKSVKYAASAGSANSVAWGNVSGRPSSLPANGGNSSTVNGHTVNSNVPSGAKFTDTVTTATTTGSGNAVTAISASNGSLTVAKDATFATKQESSNHVIASKTQPSNQQAGDIWIIIK